MNKYVVISSVIIISMLSMSSSCAVSDNNIQKDNSLEVLWNQFVETIDYIFNHDPLHYIDADNGNNFNKNNNTPVENINNTTTHHIHEENTMLSDELNNSVDSFENLSINSELVE
ncbi:MAG: hypothetical protein E7Z84_02700 [Methanosphaera stadtmanae]|nr:hypothetical protein [Methanosphaera stadtmanae]